MPTYEAIYENGELKWVGEEPEPGRHRVQVTVLDRGSESRSSEDVEQILEEAHGAWGNDITLEEIDDEIEEMRNEWERPWYPSDRS